MSNLKAVLHRVWPFFQLMLTMAWLSNLAETDAYFSIYVIISFFSFYLQIISFHSDISQSASRSILIVVLSVLFSFSVLLANYPLFTTIGDPAVIGRSTSILVNLINTILSFLGGYFTVSPIFRYVFCRFPIPCVRFGNDQKAGWIPFAVFFSFLFFNLIHLFLVEYPGNVTEDPFTQISEMVSGYYSNFNTFWHTMLLRTILSAAYFIFSDLNVAIACFCIFQIIILAFSFTYCLVTMRDFGVPKYFLIAAYGIYAFIPYHIALSITIWKDVLFAAGCLIFVTAWLRILKKLGSRRILDYFLFGAGSILFLLSRTNGWMIYLFSFLFGLFYIRKNRSFTVMMGSLAIFGWFLLNPALSFLNVPGGDPVESLSIPIQQVSRVIVDGCTLSEEDKSLLSKVVDLDEVSELYTNWLSDPMKEEIRSKNLSYFEDHISDYARLWIRLGVQYPAEYLKAWVDQTKGYWNGGYDYFLYSETITDNPYGVEKRIGSNPIASLFRLYFGLSRHVIFFEPLHSIGLHVWIAFLCFALNVVRKREHFVISLPVLILIVGLWFGTPVFCSFRYVYPLFVSFPLILSTAIFASET